MTIVEPFTYLLSVSAQKKFGKPTGYGVMSYGIDRYGVGDFRAGIYQQRHCKTGRRTIKMKFYRPTDPKTYPQQTNRGRFAAAILAWRDLTFVEQLVYDRRAVGKHMSGYNLFISEYMSARIALYGVGVYGVSLY